MERNDLIHQFSLGYPGIDQDLCVSTRFGRRTLRDLDASMEADEECVPEIDTSPLASLFDDPRTEVAA